MRWKAGMIRFCPTFEPADADGRVRIMLRLDDPSLPNWLDPVGACYGRVAWRRYGADRVEVPAIKRIRRSSLREHLPAETPQVGAAELIRRRCFISALYGY